MVNLDSLFDDHIDNDLCTGCTILKQPKAFHARMDYEDCGQADILLLSDSYRIRSGKHKIFTDDELSLIIASLESLNVSETIELATAIKCPQVKDISANNAKICRTHYEATIDKIKPKLVYAFGAGALYMSTGLKAINSKRGRVYKQTTKNGFDYLVAPVGHPFQALKEPKNRFLFDQDIRNGYDLVIKKKTGKMFKEYDFLDSLEKLEKYKHLTTYEGLMASDIEGSGLNFLKDKLYTIAFATATEVLVVPLFHPDNPLIEHIDQLVEFVAAVLSNPKSYKIFHNASFDLKFLFNAGFKVVNVHDTKLMAKLSNENTPNGLLDLMRTYFPTELA